MSDRNKPLPFLVPVSFLRFVPPGNDERPGFSYRGQARPFEHKTSRPQRDSKHFRPLTDFFGFHRTNWY